MQGLLVAVAGWMLASLISRVLIGAGLAVATYIGISAAVTAALDMLQTTWSTLGAAGNILALAGFGTFVSIVGSALVSAATFAAAKVVLVRN